MQMLNAQILSALLGAPATQPASSPLDGEDGLVADSGTFAAVLNVQAPPPEAPAQPASPASSPTTVSATFTSATQLAPESPAQLVPGSSLPLSGHQLPPRPAASPPVHRDESMNADEQRAPPSTPSTVIPLASRSPSQSTSTSTPTLPTHFNGGLSAATAQIVTAMPDADVNEKAHATNRLQTNVVDVYRSSELKPVHSRAADSAQTPQTALRATPGTSASAEMPALNVTPVGLRESVQQLNAQSGPTGVQAPQSHTQGYRDSQANLIAPRQVARVHQPIEQESGPRPQVGVAPTLDSANDVVPESRPLPTLKQAAPGEPTRNDVDPQTHVHARVEGKQTARQTSVIMQTPFMDNTAESSSVPARTASERSAPAAPTPANVVTGGSAHAQQGTAFNADTSLYSAERQFAQDQLAQRHNLAPVSQTNDFQRREVSPNIGTERTAQRPNAVTPQSTSALPQGVPSSPAASAGSNHTADDPSATGRIQELAVARNAAIVPGQAADIPVTSVSPAPANQQVQSAPTAPQTNANHPSSAPLATEGNAPPERFGYVATPQTNSASLELNPKELGPMQVRIAIADDQARVSFTVNHAYAKESIEMTLPQFREQFENGTLSLSSVDVSEQSPRQTTEREQHAARQTARDGSDDRDQKSKPDSESDQPPRERDQGLLDLFA